MSTNQLDAVIEQRVQQRPSFSAGRVYYATRNLYPRRYRCTAAAAAAIPCRYVPVFNDKNVVCARPPRALARVFAAAYNYPVPPKSRIVIIITHCAEYSRLLHAASAFYARRDG